MGRHVDIINTCFVVQAYDIPDEVIEYLCEEEISTHYQNDVVVIKKSKVGIPDADNLFTLWLIEEAKKQGISLLEGEGDYIYVAIIAT